MVKWVINSTLTWATIPKHRSVLIKSISRWTIRVKKMTLSNPSKQVMYPWTWTIASLVVVVHCSVWKPIWSSANWKYKPSYRNKIQKVNPFLAKVVHRLLILRCQLTRTTKTVTSSLVTISGIITSKPWLNYPISLAALPSIVLRFG